MAVKIVAEISANHRGREQEAYALVEMAKECGADYVKFQLFDPLQMAVDPRPYYQNLTPWDWFPRLFAHARKIGIEPFASVFDLHSLESIRSLEPAYIKIASFENSHWPLIDVAHQTGIPLIISTGMMSRHELRALRTFLDDQDGEITWLKCTSAYPAPDQALNLGAIRKEHKMGFSDHTKDHVAAIAAVGAGAIMLERHIALSDDAVDASCSSVGLLAFEAYVDAVRRAEAMCGTNFGPQPQELTAARRAIYSTRDIKLNEKFTDDNVAVLRGPGGGVHPKHYWVLLKRSSSREISAGEPIVEGDFR